MTVSSVRNVGEFKQSMSLNLKILLNYIQILTIMQGFELNWPFYVRNYLNGIAILGGGLSTQEISLDCVLENYNINISSLYAQTIIMSFLPLIIYVIAGVVLFLNFISTKNSQIVRMVVVVIVVSLFMQPSIITTLFNNLSCTKMDNASYLVKNMEISCDSDSYHNWVLISHELINDVIF